MAAITNARRTSSIPGAGTLNLNTQAPWIGPTQANIYGSNVPQTAGYGDLYGQGQAMLGNLSKALGGGAGGGGGYYAGPKYPTPGSQLTKDYITDIQGGQNLAMQGLVKNASAAGMRRAGSNVVGGPANDSAGWQAATAQMASMYPQLYEQAMGYGKSYGDAWSSYYNNLMNQQNAMFGNLTNLAQLQNQAQSSYLDRAAQEQAANIQRTQQEQAKQKALQDEAAQRNAANAAAYQQGSQADFLKYIKQQAFINNAPGGGISSLMGPWSQYLIQPSNSSIGGVGSKFA